MSSTADLETRVIALESNPEVMTKYSRGLGAEIGTWVDIFALDEESLTAIPQPVVAVILLYPYTEKHIQSRTEHDAEIKEKGQIVSPNLFYMKQTVRNACGGIAVIHSLANNTEEVGLQPGLLRNFLDEVADLSPLERAKHLEKSVEILKVHDRAAEEGQTETPLRTDKVTPHFVAFVHKDGSLYELDGGREWPVNHGPTTPESLLKDAAGICQSKINQDPSNYRFSVVALTTAFS